MRKYFFILYGLFICCNGYAAAPHNYKADLENILEEERIAFDSMVVEDTIKNNMHSNYYDVETAANTYDMLAEKNNGYFSLTELFYVCLQSFIDKPINAWNACKRDFIVPLLMESDELSFIDDVIVEAYDGHSFNQPCRPPETEPAKGGLVRNAICTTGYYEDIDPAFEKAMITKFRTEGGCAYVNDGNGKTCYGVAGRVHPEVYRKDFSRADAERIGYTHYYTKYNIDKLPDAIRGDVFMAVWGTGSASRSIKLLQKVMGIYQSGEIDEETISAAENYAGNLRKEFLKARWNNMKHNGNFSNGWAKAFIVYLKNGCHTVPSIPLERNEETVAECKKMQ